ncbi:MAG: glutamate--tRNA ligase [Candidatus Kerfeldbacteria bacterium]|nr:glutamate--tRNA ligase [Candidatus Kerfeldbacteria bacterium]
MRSGRGVRVRFAPSPTGEPHVGSIWTALFNFLFARQTGGAFVLRLEDTDQKRLVPGAAEKIYQALDWYGLTPDEGPQRGGPFRPYVQSQRRELHQQHARQLVEQGNAYYCFCTTERLEQLRQAQVAAKRAPRYDKHCAAIPLAEVSRRVASGENAVIRINLPLTGTVVHHDIIRRQVTFRYDQLDDSVLLKSDGFPTYHLANVVDDHVMEISHVIRAEEWLPSVPKHLFLHRAFGWEPPQFAHLPLLLGSDRSKLSKRHGATSALSFRDEGYLPEAMRNFLALMGWHPKDDREVRSLEELIRDFRLADVNPSGAIFDRTKLDWLNGVYIRSMDIDEFVRRVEPFWHQARLAQVSNEWRRAALMIVRDRMRRLSEVDDLTAFGFSSVWDEQRRLFDFGTMATRHRTAAQAKGEIDWFMDWLDTFSEPWNATSLKINALAAIAAAGKKNGDVLWPVRVGLTLRPASPDVFDVMQLLGKGETRRRLRTFLT